MVWPILCRILVLPCGCHMHRLLFQLHHVQTTCAKFCVYTHFQFQILCKFNFSKEKLKYNKNYREDMLNQHACFESYCWKVLRQIHSYVKLSQLVASLWTSCIRTACPQLSTSWNDLLTTFDKIDGNIRLVVQVFFIRPVQNIKL